MSLVLPTKYPDCFLGLDIDRSAFSYPYLDSLPSFCDQHGRQLKEDY